MRVEACNALRNPRMDTVSVGVVVVAVVAVVAVVVVVVVVAPVRVPGRGDANGEPPVAAWPPRGAPSVSMATESLICMQRTEFP